MIEFCSNYASAIKGQEFKRGQIHEI